MKPRPRSMSWSISARKSDVLPEPVVPTTARSAGTAAGSSAAWGTGAVGFPIPGGGVGAGVSGIGRPDLGAYRVHRMHGQTPEIRAPCRECNECEEPEADADHRGGRPR